MNRHELFTQTTRHYLTPILKWLDDPMVAEVMVNSYNDIYIEKNGKIEKLPVQFADVESYESAVNNVLQFTGKTLGSHETLIDARLPDGSRVHVAKPPCARAGMAMTIRKFAKTMLDIDWLVHIGSLTDASKEYIRLAVQAEQNLLVAGGTSSGKTSLLNCLSSFIPNKQRIVVIEDSAELQLQQEHVVSLEAKAPDRFDRGAVTIRDLFKSSLRLRPDRIIIGEVRSGEALDMIQAMTSGHGGSMGTLHANSALDALNRLETMALMSQVELPLSALRSQISSAIDVVVQTQREFGGKRRITQISEVLPLGGNGYYQINDIFTSQPTLDEKGVKTMQLKPTGMRSTFSTHLSNALRETITPLTEDIFSEQ